METIVKELNHCKCDGISWNIGLDKKVQLPDDILFSLEDKLHELKNNGIIDEYGPHSYQYSRDTAFGKYLDKSLGIFKHYLIKNGKHCVIGPITKGYYILAPCNKCGEILIFDEGIPNVFCGELCHLEKAVVKAFSLIYEYENNKEK